MTEVSGLRFFVSNCNGVIGQSMVDEFRNDHLDDPLKLNMFVGTVNANENALPPMLMKRIIQKGKVHSLRRFLLDSDVIIYDLQTADLEEVEFAIKTLSTTQFEDPRTLIIISSVHSWANTPPILTENVYLYIYIYILG